MARRVMLPTADELFRSTAPRALAEAPRTPDRGGGHAVAEAAGADTVNGVGGDRMPSGRIRHDEKMTVYVTADELIDLEQARLHLRRTHGLAVDRGRFVRQAIAIALADLHLRGEESVLVQRLRQP